MVLLRGHENALNTGCICTMGSPQICLLLVLSSLGRGGARIVLGVRISFNGELMSLIRPPGLHHFETPGWNLLSNMLCVSQ